MANLSEDIQCAGSDTRPPMLDRTDFASWQQRIRLYCRGKENGVNILKSIDEGPFQMGTFRETLAEGNEGALHLGPERPRVYSDLSPEDKERYNADIRATNILLQGLPKDIYTLINHYTDAKDIWDNVKMLLEGAAGYGGAQNRVRNSNPGQARQIKCYNCNGIGHIARNCTQPKRPQNSEYFKDKMLLMQDQENKVALDEQQLLFIASGQDNVVDEDVDEQPVQDLALNMDNVFQADDCDAFDSDVDEAPTAQTMFMANLSSAYPIYDEAMTIVQSNVSSILNDAYMMILDDIYELRAKFELTEREQKINEQLRIVIVDRKRKEENLKREFHSVKLQLTSTINHNKSMVEEVTSLKKDFKQKENKYLEEFLDMKALKEKVEDKLYKQDQSLLTVHMLCKPKPYYDKQNKKGFILATNFELTESCFTWKFHLAAAHIVVLKHFVVWNLKPSFLNYLISFGNNTSLPTRDVPDFDSDFVIEKMKASIQGKDNAIKKLRMKISQLNETYSDADRTRDFRTLDFQITQLTKKINVLQEQNELFRAENGKIKQHYKELYDSIKIMDHVKPKVLAPRKYAIDVEPIPPSNRNNREVHLVHLKHFKESVETIRKIVEEAKVERPLDSSLASACRYTKHSQELLEYVVGTCLKALNTRDNKHASTSLPEKKQVTFEEQCAMSKSNTHKPIKQLNCQKTNVPVPPSTGVNSCTDASRSQLRSNTKKNKIFPPKMSNKNKRHPPPVKKVVRKVSSKSGNLSKSNASPAVPGSIPTPPENKEIAYANQLDPNQNWGSNFPNSSSSNFMKKFIKTFRFRNDHFGAIMGYGDYVIGDSVISKEAFIQDEVLPNMFVVQSLQEQIMVMASSFKPLELLKEQKAYPENTNLEVLNTLHMDLCGPMRVQTINGKKYILVIVDDYSRYIRTDNGTEFVNQVLTEYYERVGIFHQQSVPKTPHQNGIVERRNRTLVEAARTMLIFSKALMFLWAEAIATACYTQN
ncbi:integrase, catalytic region, zinc finger, CCHC-type containing protein [Tanacetum coccineum]